MYTWLLTLKDPVTGGFMMHVDGEVDIRGTYCALAVASLLNIVTPQLLKGVPSFIANCQTYEGGMGGYPGNEAHGGYTFCGVAAAVLAQAESHINLPLVLVRACADSWPLVMFNIPSGGVFFFSSFLSSQALAL